MRESMPDTSGEYVDRGPRVRRTIPDGFASQVTRFLDDGRTIHERPYDPKELRALVRAGKELPRPLTLRESQRATRNRAEAREQYRAMERWAVELGGKRTGGRSDDSPVVGTRSPSPSWENAVRVLEGG